MRDPRDLARQEARADRLARGEADVEHGTFTTWNNWLCRCEPCVAAGKKYGREYYLSHRGASARRQKNPARGT